MALVNKIKREINAKLVFFGPGLSGKTTNLNHIYSKLKPEFRGKLKSMNIQNDKMLFFDFTPPGDGKVNGYSVRFHIYTIKGETKSSSPWKMVLKGADGVVFVADSAPDRMTANRESLRNLAEYLGAYGQNPEDIPLVFEYNKRDRVDAVPLEDLQRMLNPGNLPGFPATASNGDGVLNALLALVRMVLKKLRETGLELEAGVEKLQGVSEQVAVESLQAQVQAQVEQEGKSFAYEDEVTTVSLAEEEIAAEPEASIVAAPSIHGDEPEVSLHGDVEMVAPGRLRLPITIKYAGREKTIALNLTVSLD